MVKTDVLGGQDQAKIERNVWRILRAGYFDRLQERHGFNEQLEDCSSPESAYLLDIEQKYMVVPSDLTFENLEPDIDPQHRERIYTFWKKVIAAQEARSDAVADLLDHWKTAPDSHDAEAAEVLDAMTITIRSEFQSALKATITLHQDGNGTDIKKWKRAAKNYRQSFLNADNNYLVALRIYYEMLLEHTKPTEEQESQYIIPKEHPGRQKIAIHNRYVRLIDAVHKASTTAKAGHHNQKKRNIRKTEMEPYSHHPIQVMMAHLADVIPYTIEQQPLQYDPVLGTIIAAVHDLAEDTNLSIDEVVAFFQRMDKYDSSLDQVIQSGFGMSRDNFKKNVLDLAGRHIVADMKVILSVISNDLPQQLAASEQRRALDMGIAPAGKIIGAMQVKNKEGKKVPLIPTPHGTESLLKSFNVDGNRVTSKTFQQFPEVGETATDKKMDDKMTSFLVKLNLMVTKERRQTALIIKMEDRAHNISQLEGRDLDTQFSTLRTTTARLIAWAMLDYDDENCRYPLYGALQRLIHETLHNYLRLQQQQADLITTKDTQYIEQLKIWYSEARRYELPENVQVVFNRWNFDRRETVPSGVALSETTQTVSQLAQRILVQ